MVSPKMLTHAAFLAINVFITVTESRAEPAFRTAIKELHAIYGPVSGLYNSSVDYVDQPKKVPKTFQDFAVEGVAYYKAWQDKTGPDAPFPAYVPTIMKTDSDDSLCVMVETTRILLRMGVNDPTANWVEETASWPKRKSRTVKRKPAIFESILSAKAGVFIAADDDRGAMPKHATFPGIAWWQWVRVVNRETEGHEESEDQEAGVDYSGLKLILQEGVINDDSRRLIKEAIPANSPADRYSWEPGGQTDLKNPFWALIASPNGKGMIEILTERKVALNGKGIQKLYVQKDSILDTFTMWITLE